MSLPIMRSERPPAWWLLGALAVSASLSGCFGGDDVVVQAAAPPPASEASAPLTAAQIATAQSDLDSTSAPVDITSAGSGDIAVSQTALDQQAGVTPEAQR